MFLEIICSALIIPRTPIKLIALLAYQSFDPATFQDQSSETCLITPTPLLNAVNPNRGTSSSSSPTPHVWATADILANILNSYPFVHQARLLFILYGPVHKGISPFLLLIN